MDVAPKGETAPRADAPAARALALPRLADWRRPARRVASIGLLFVAWHVATTRHLDLYVRFQNIPAPALVLEEGIELFGGVDFYVHLLARPDRIWLGFPIPTALGIGPRPLIG